MIEILKNPMSSWLKWYVGKLVIEYQNISNHLSVGYLTQVKNCSFGLYNRLSAHSCVFHSSFGDYSYIGDYCRIARASIGKFTSIGPEVLIGLGSHPSKGTISTHPIFYSAFYGERMSLIKNTKFDECLKTVVGNDVWIGARAILIDGVVVGDGAIIGAGAVVTKNVPPYAVVAGVPARVIRYRFSQLEINSLLKIKWWDRGYEWLKANLSMREDLTNFFQIVESD